MKQLELFEIEPLPPEHPIDRHGYRWNAYEEELLIQAVANYKTSLEIAKMLGRRDTAVESRRRRLGLKRRFKEEV